MQSVFFQISRTDFLEAATIYNSLDYALRIVSIVNGTVHYIYLHQMTLKELSLLVALLRAKMINGVTNANDLYRYVQAVTYYY